MKGRCTITVEGLQRQALEQLHSNHMGNQKKQDYHHANLFTELI